MGARWSVCDFILETDNASVIEKIKIGGINRSLVTPVIHNTLLELAHLRSVAFVKIGREQNIVAHELARLALRSGGGGCQVCG